MKLIYLISILFTLFNNHPDESLPVLAENDLHDWQIIETRFFSSNDLYGYIDGGAEIYHEYGFSKLAVQDIQKAKLELKVEVFKMVDTRSAFGVFSVSQRNCPVVANLAAFSCSNPYQLLVCRGPYFITITNYEGSEAAQQSSLPVMKKILGKIKEADFTIPLLFRVSVLDNYRNNLRYIRGRIGLQNGYPQWIELLDGLPFDMLILPFEKGKQWTALARIQFRKSKNVNQFLANAGMNRDQTGSNWIMQSTAEKKQALQIVGEKTVIYAESSPDYDLNQFIEQIGNGIEK